MFKLTRRSATIALLAAGSLGSGLSADPASAAGIIAVAPAGQAAVHPGQTGLLLPAVHPGETGLLLPAVQKVREAAAR